MFLNFDLHLVFLFTAIRNMDSEVVPSSKNVLRCSNCGCSCSLVIGASGTWFRSVKRKYDEFEKSNQFFVPGLEIVPTARVGMENECNALRETVSSQQQTIQDLCAELEEERNASASAANETMSMILRLQREKAEIQMEARQFKRFAEERMAHDQQEISALEDLLYKREQIIQSLSCEVQAYKHRLMSFGLTEEEADGFGLSSNSSMRNIDSQLDSTPYDYPPLRCKLNETRGLEDCDDEDDVDIDKYAFGETPHGRGRLETSESRIYQIEASSSYSQQDGDITGTKDVIEKVIVGDSPETVAHSRKISSGSSNSFFGLTRENIPESAESVKCDITSKKTEFVSKREENFRKVDDLSQTGDEMSDRVYTIDSVFNGASNNGASKTVGAVDDYVTTQKADIADPKIQKLCMRLQELEADRESMRQALITLGTDKAQMVLLKEIAQHLSKEVPPERRMPVKKVPSLGIFSFISILKVGQFP